MEQKIKLQPKINYELTEDDMRRMFLSMTLFQYRFERRENYDEDQLIKLLAKDNREFLLELSKTLEKDSNNHILNKLHAQISKYHTFLKREVKSLEE